MHLCWKRPLRSVSVVSPAQSRVQRGVSKHLALQQVSCAAGLTEVAVPVDRGLQACGYAPERPDPPPGADRARLRATGPIAGWGLRRTGMAQGHQDRVFFDARAHGRSIQCDEPHARSCSPRSSQKSVGSESVTATETEPESVVSAKKIIQERMAESLDSAEHRSPPGAKPLLFLPPVQTVDGHDALGLRGSGEDGTAKVMLITRLFRIAEIGLFGRIQVDSPVQWRL
jgi:hypothetical protein